MRIPDFERVTHEGVRSELDLGFVMVVLFVFMLTIVNNGG